MTLLLSHVTFRYSQYRKEFCYVGNLHIDDAGKVHLRHVSRHSLPIEHRPPLAVYSQDNHHLMFTIKGIHILREFKVNISTDLPIDSVTFDDQE